MELRVLVNVPRYPRILQWLYGCLAHDPLGAPARPTPHPIVVVLFSTLFAVVLLGLRRFGGRYGLHMPMYDKEGFLENLTFLLDMWAAVLCGLAALRTFRQRSGTQDTLIVASYWLCAGLLFFVAMEEISWGQQLVTFRTPEAWLAVNHQHETTLHNLASRDGLTLAWKVVASVFGVGAIALMVAAEVTESKVLRFVAPHPALAPLALLTIYAGVKVHPELAEVLIAIFFAYYGYRVYVASPPGLRKA